MYARLSQPCNSFITTVKQIKKTNLWKGPIVPDVAMVRETVGNISEFSLLYVLFDWVQRVLGGYLDGTKLDYFYIMGTVF